MNTKTTKFLAVLAVLAMAFAGFAVLNTADQGDASSTKTVNVDEVTISYPDDLAPTVDGTSVSFIGTTAGLTSIDGYTLTTTYEAAFASVSLGVDSDLAISKIVVTDSAMQSVTINGLTGGSISGKVLTVTGSALTGFAIPVPSDGSSVDVKMYVTTDGEYVLAKSLTLDFADTYTKVSLSSSDTRASYGYDATTGAAGWSIASNALILQDYTGNNIFSLAASATVTVKGTNILGMKIADKVTVSGDAYVIGSAGDMTIKTKDETVGSIDSLSINVEIGDAVVGSGDGGMSGIFVPWGNYDLDMSAFAGALAIDIDGTLKSGYTNVTAIGIHASHSATGELKIGKQGIPTTLDINVEETDGYSDGIWAGVKNDLYINGSIQAGGVAIRTNSTADGYLKMVGDKLYLSGSESAMKDYSVGATTLGITELTMEISGEGVYNTGNNGFYALTMKDDCTTNATLVIPEGCTVTTDGAYFGIAIGLTGIEGKLIVKGDYAANPDSKILPQISGLYWAPTTAGPTVYNEVPTGVTSYILLGDDCETFGPITVKNKSGTVVEKTVTDITTITTANLSAWADEGVTKVNVIYASGTEASAITVPKTMTLSIDYTAAAGTVHTITCNDKSFVVDTDFKGIIVVDKDGLEIQKFEAGNLKDVRTDVTISGNITAGTITGDDYASTITFVDSTNVTAFAIQANQANIIVDSDATLNLSGTMEIKKKSETTKSCTMTVNGDIVEKAVGGLLKISLGDLIVNGNVYGFSDDTDMDIELADGTSATFNGVVGAIDGSNSYRVVVGASSDSDIEAKNLTGGFKVSAASSAITLNGTISRDLAKSATIVFDNAKAKDLTISKNIEASTTSTANDLTVIGNLVVAGKFVTKDDVSDLVISTSGSLSGTGYVTGQIAIGTTVVSLPAINTDLVYLTGYTFAYASSKATVSGTLGSSDSSNTAWTLSVASGMLYADSLTLGKKITLSVAADASIIGAVNGPSGEKVTLNATADSVALVLTGGSLVVSGQFKDKDDSAAGIIVSTGTVTIGKITSGALTTALTLGGDAVGEVGTLEVAGGATADVGAAAGAIVAGTGTGALNLDSGSDLTGASYITTENVSIEVASGAETDSFITGAKYANGATMQYTVQNTSDALTGKTVRVVFVTPTGSEKQYAIGAILYNYTGTGASPVTSDNLKYYAVQTDSTHMGTTADGNIATAGAVVGTVSDAVGIYKDAITVTFAGYTEKAPIEVIGAAITVVIDISGTTDNADNFDADSYDSTWTVDSTVAPTKITKVYYIGNTTDTFGTLPTAIDSSGKYVLDHYALKGQTGSTFDPSVSVYTYTNKFAQTLITLEPVMKDITKTTYTVKFDSNGGSAVADQTVAYKKTVTKPADPTLSGKDFAGWYSDAKLTTKYNFKSLVTADMTLYAKWTDAEPTATSVDIAVSKVTGGVKVTVAGADDLVVPTGTVTVTYYYWVTIAGQKAIDDKDATAAITMSGIVNSTTVSLDKTPVYVVVSYESADGKVTATTPIIMY